MSDEIGEIIGITIVNAQWLAEHDGRIVVTIPDSVRASGPLETPASQLAEALAASPRTIPPLKWRNPRHL